MKYWLTVRYKCGTINCQIGQQRRFKMMTQEQVDRIKAKAEETAQMFVDEFGEPLNPSMTDWDATAWQEDGRALFGDNGELRDEGWPIYQKTLIAETEFLAAQHEYERNKE